MSVLIKGMKMPIVCDDCNFLDERGDYPMCRVTQETRGYDFPVQERRMARCPIIPIPDYFLEDNGIVYSRESNKHMTKDEAISEFLDIIGE